MKINICLTEKQATVRYNSACSGGKYNNFLIHEVIVSRKEGEINTLYNDDQPIQKKRFPFFKKMFIEIIVTLIAEIIAMQVLNGNFFNLLNIIIAAQFSESAQSIRMMPHT
jgi:hypothetical protein